MFPNQTGVTNGVSPTPQAGNGQGEGPATVPDILRPGGAADPGTGAGHEESVPYERFQQVLKENQDLKAWAPVLDKIRNEAGFATPAEVLAFAAQQEEVRQAQEIQTKLQAKIDRGDLDPDGAEEIYNAQVQALQLSQRLSATEKRQAAAELKAARADYPEMDEEYVALAFAAGEGSITDLAKKSHEKNEARLTSRSASYKEQKEELGSRPVPIRAGGGPAGRTSIPNPIQDPEGWAKYEKQVASELARR